MTQVTLCGGGKIGLMAARFLSGTNGDYEVLVLDRDTSQFDRFKDLKNVTCKVADLSKKDAIVAAAKGTDFILSTAPYFFTTSVAGAARELEAHYVDLTEDVAASKIVRDTAKGANSAFIPQSGLAPGFISIAAYHLAKEFDALDEVKMRVGALAKYPNNAIKYNLTWSTAGLINEYCEPCNAIVDGEYMQILPLEGYEHFTMDGVNYECFNTSGGLGTLCETLKGKVRNLNYKSIRYPGHLEVMRFLINDLKMKDKQDLLIQILEDAVPATKQDAVLIYVSVSGTKNGQFLTETYAVKVYSHEYEGHYCSGIQLTTAGAACAIIDMVRDGTLPQKGLIKQEDIPFDAFLANRFGRVYAPGEISAVSV
ncbi:MAG: saccharopine dehydrogenase family protein [Pseudobdellovibrionaceae bacterium]